MSAFPFVVGMYSDKRRSRHMFEVCAVPIMLAAGHTLATSALPDAPVIAERAAARRVRRRSALALRRFAARLAAA